MDNDDFNLFTPGGSVTNTAAGPEGAGPSSSTSTSHPRKTTSEAGAELSTGARQVLHLNLQCTSRSIIEPRRTSLTHEMVEVLTCLQDWEHARMSIQHQMEDEEVIPNFSNLYIDEGSSSNQEEP
ncbi:hypothetical protein Dsin_001870 [Dipteronia sinensis]|uniref:HAT C-terminal dimerisation domain-containing protein n=1 Tax=Dipteronia sinensis TaxID=43782 RepID=A0AAE0EJ57_9ROSI|nr:hypothetical protein Dsin_001870 [Dipteronia sinensis]